MVVVAVVDLEDGFRENVDVRVDIVNLAVVVAGFVDGCVVVVGLVLVVGKVMLLWTDNNTTGLLC